MIVVVPLLAVGIVVVAAAGDLKRGGLHPCDRLDARLCADLGPGTCDVWMNRLHRVGAASVERRHWPRNRTVIADVAIHKILGWDSAHADNPLCYTELADDVYPKILAAVRAACDNSVRTHPM